MTITPTQLRESAARQRAAAPDGATVPLADELEAAADEIERLRTIMYRIVDEDCTVAVQNGTFYADGEPLFAISDTTQPRNGAVDTPDSHPTPGEGSTP